MSDGDWLPFTVRLGFGGGRWPEVGHLGWRHSRDDHEGCEPSERVRCACPGIHDRPPCCGRASQEDRLCDGCREHCWAVDNAQQMHRLIDLDNGRVRR